MTRTYGYFEEESEDTKGVIIIRKSKDTLQWQKKRTKRQTTIYKIYT